MTTVSVNRVDIPFFGWGSEGHERFSQNGVAQVFANYMQPSFT